MQVPTPYKETNKKKCPIAATNYRNIRKIVCSVTRNQSNLAVSDSKTLLSRLRLLAESTLLTFAACRSVHRLHGCGSTASLCALIKMSFACYCS
jgi:hypothetical protein